MSDFEFGIRLKAFTKEFVKDMRQSGVKVKRTFAEMQTASQQAKQKIKQQFEENNRSASIFAKGLASVKVQLAGLAAGAAVGAAFAAALQSSRNLEAQLSRVAAVSGATSEEIDRLKQAAEEAGNTTRYNATQAAEGLEILARAGYSVDESISLLPTLLNVATAEGLALSDAAQLVTDTLSIMGLEVENGGRAADVLAKGASLANTTMQQLGEAISYSGQYARESGIPLEGLVGILDVLAKNGLRGERAGTGLRSILAQLSDPASKASKELEALGVSTDSLESVIDGLADAGERGEDAINAFGIEAGPALRALLSEGTAGLREYVKALDSSEGAVKKMADVIQDNLDGAIVEFGSVWDALRRKLTDPLLKPLADDIKALSGKFRELIEEGNIQPFGSMVVEVFTRISGVVQFFYNSFTFAAKAVGAAISQIIVWVAQLEYQIARFANAIGLVSDGTLEAVRQQVEAMKAVRDSFAAEAIVDSNDLSSAIDKVINGSEALAYQAKETGDALEESGKKGKKAGEETKDGADKAYDAIERTNQQISDYVAALEKQEQAIQAAAQETTGLTEAEIEQQIANIKLQQEIEKKTEAVHKAQEGSVEYKLALLELQQTIESGKGSVNHYALALEKMGRSELKTEISSLETSLSKLEKQWKGNSISIKEYNDEKGKLEEAIRTAKDALGDEARSLDEVSRKADSAKNSVRDLGAAYRDAGKNAVSLQHSQGEIQAALVESGNTMDGLQAKLGELDRRFKLGLETEASYAEKKQTIKAEMDKLQETVEGLTKSLDSLNNAENKNQQSTETSTRKYTLYKQQLNHTGSSLDELSERSVVLRRYMQRAAHAIDPLWRRVFSVTAELAKQELAVIKDEKAFRRYEEALGDSTLSMAKLEQMSRWANSSTRALDQSRLDSLISSIEQAKQEMIDLRDEAEDTARSVEERLARALGDYDKAIKLQFKEELDELKQKLEEARDRGDTESANNYRDAIRNTETLRNIELDKAKDREKETPARQVELTFNTSDGQTATGYFDDQSADTVIDELENLQFAGS